jgi:hypothetical protein
LSRVQGIVEEEQEQPKEDLKKGKRKKHIPSYLSASYTVDTDPLSRNQR